MARKPKAPKPVATAVPPSTPAAAATLPVSVVQPPTPATPPASAAPPPPAPEPATAAAAPGEVMEPTYWRKNGWSARVIKNGDDDGWAVEIHKDDLPEPVLVSPWVMGRDKKNPKPFDAGAFATFVKTASEVLDRSERQRAAALTKSLHLAWDGVWYKILLVLVPDEYEPYGTLTATTDDGETVATLRVPPDYKLTRDGAAKWVRRGFESPG